MSTSSGSSNPDVGEDTDDGWRGVGGVEAAGDWFDDDEGVDLLAAGDVARSSSNRQQKA